MVKLYFTLMTARYVEKNVAQPYPKINAILKLHLTNNLSFNLIILNYLSEIFKV